MPGWRRHHGEQPERQQEEVAEGRAKGAEAGVGVAPGRWACRGLGKHPLCRSPALLALPLLESPPRRKWCGGSAERTPGGGVERGQPLEV